MTYFAKYFGPEVITTWCSFSRGVSKTERERPQGVAVEGGQVNPGSTGLRNSLGPTLHHLPTLCHLRGQVERSGDERRNRGAGDRALLSALPKPLEVTCPQGATSQTLPFPPRAPPWDGIGFSPRRPLPASLASFGSVFTWEFGRKMLSGIFPPGE